MEALTRLVADSLARHGFDRPVDFRRLQWSRWFHCDSQHSLLYVPSKPGVFALAEEILSDVMPGRETAPDHGSNREGRDFSRANIDSYQGTASAVPADQRNEAAALAAEVLSKPEAHARRMLAVTQFFEADDMAFTLDRMLSRPNPMRARLESGRYFIRFVVIEDSHQRRTVCSALNQWIVSSAEKASGLGAHFASSLELTPANENTSTVPGIAPSIGEIASSQRSSAPPGVNSATNVTPLKAATSMAQRSPLFPSGF